MSTSRRRFLHTSSGLFAGGLVAAIIPARTSAQAPAPTASAKAPPRPPLSAEKVQAVVGQSHRSLEKVRELVLADPLLANACWDWGGGDFETLLQAAAHTGGREIAEFLLGQGARLDLYAASMLGWLDFVKAALAADPVKLAAVPGPHGFTLLHCAKRGGDVARPVYDYLLAQGVPEVFQRPLPYTVAPAPAPTS